MPNPVPRLPERRDLTPEAPITVLLTNGTRVLAERFHIVPSSDDGHLTLADDEGFIYTIPADAIAATIVRGDLMEGE